MELTPLSAISAIDGRYRKQVQHLDEYFSEYALMKYRVMIEVEYLLFLEKKKFLKLSNKTVKHLQKLIDDFGLEDAQEIKQIEYTTNHDVRMSLIIPSIKKQRNGYISDLRPRILIIRRYLYCGNTLLNMSTCRHYLT
jgi:hypothetical protein